MPAMSLEKRSSRQAYMSYSDISKSFLGCHIDSDIDASDRRQEGCRPKKSSLRSMRVSFNPTRAPAAGGGTTPAWVIDEPNFHAHVFNSTTFHKHSSGERSTDFDYHFSHGGLHMVDDKGKMP